MKSCFITQMKLRDQNPWVIEHTAKLLPKECSLIHAKLFALTASDALYDMDISNSTRFVLQMNDQAIVKAIEESVLHCSNKNTKL